MVRIEGVVVETYGIFDFFEDQKLNRYPLVRWRYDPWLKINIVNNVVVTWCSFRMDIFDGLLSLGARYLIKWQPVLR